ncbi:MAG: hypothetical protein NVSMB65_12530 [Chloroflexota bacterium]
MSVEENKAIIRQWDEAVSRKDLAFINAHPGLGEGKAFFTELFAAFPDLKVTAQNVVAEGDWVTERIMVSGTHQDTFMGMPATGKHASWEVITMNRVVGGKIIESYGQADDMGMMRQLGLSPGAGGSPPTQS